MLRLVELPLQMDVVPVIADAVRGLTVTVTANVLPTQVPIVGVTV